MGCFSVFFPKTCTQKAIWDKTICDVANLFIVFEAIPSIVITLEPTTRLRQKSAPLFSVTFRFLFRITRRSGFRFRSLFLSQALCFRQFLVAGLLLLAVAGRWVMGCCRHKKRTSDRLVRAYTRFPICFSFRIIFFAPRTLNHFAP